MGGGRIYRNYPGDSPAKAAVRQGLYDCVADLWKHSRPRGDAVVLAGPQAPEVSLLRDLGFSANQCLFVDHMHADTLREIPERWSGARTFHGDLEAVLPTVRSIAFANVDLMGQMNVKAERILQQASLRAVPGAVVSYTFFRTRETHTTKTGARLLDIVGGKEALNPASRWAAVRYLVCRAISRPAEIIYERKYVAAGRLGVIALKILS